MTTEHIFVIGGTGNIGKALVKDLLAKNASMTLLARDPAKVATLFPDNKNIQVVQGDLQDTNLLKDAFKGHSRLFLIVDPFNPNQSKATIAQYAYEAGIKQIVDISSITASAVWRTSFLGNINRKGEQDVLNIPNRGTYVCLRPGRFISNIFLIDGISPEGKIVGIEEESESQGWISTNDIGSIAANILSEDIEKHGDNVYELVSEAITHAERAQLLSRVLERDIKYQKIAPIERYNFLINTFGVPHSFAYEFSSSRVSSVSEDKIVLGMSILLGREPETFVEYIKSVRHLL